MFILHRSARRFAVLACALFIGAASLPALAQPSAVSPRGNPVRNDAAEKPRQFASMSYWASELVAEYGLEHPGLPPIEEIANLPIRLVFANDGYRAPRSIDDPMPIPLKRLAARSSGNARRARFYADALLHVNRSIIEAFAGHGIAGVVITLPDIEEGTGRDLRPQDEQRLRLRIFVARVAELHSFADGALLGGLDRDARTDHERHRWILEQAPIQPVGERSLLYIDELEDYARRLSRHPGRRVDAKLAPGLAPGTSNVTLRVAENRPWNAYANISNTGTGATTRLRERFGFAHHQVTGRDDIFNVDYITGDFDFVHAVYGSYEMPIWKRGGPRVRLYGSYSQYNATDLGFPDANVSGNQWDSGLDLVATVFQHRDLFVDLVAGSRWQNVEVDNEVTNQRGRTNFFLPKVGFSIERPAATSFVRIGGRFEFNVADFAGTGSADDLRDFGRFDIDRDFEVFRWTAIASSYLEPLIFPAAWRDPRTPLSSTLAHEVVLRYNGQWSIGNRLPPQHEQTVGGLHSVRGYPQAIGTGDTAHIASAEYRLHVPRLVLPSNSRLRLPWIGDFRLVPPHIYGMPDWDFIVKAFLDYGHVASVPSDTTLTEPDRTLIGAGLGFELTLRNNLSARFDVGWALDNARGRTQVGASELHFLVSARY